MSAVRMDGKALSAKVRGSILAETEELKKKGVTPGLAVIIVGNDPASEIYVRNKERACEQCGFYSEKYALPEETSQEELLGLIAQLNESPQISGILCQMPVPKHISEQAVIDAIDPRKDVDAFHPVNVGKIMVGNFDFVPCTPAGVMELLDEYQIDPKGKECVVVGRSNIVGKPMSMLLLHRHGTVTICHSRTQDLAEVCRRADILVAAVGKAGFITALYVVLVPVFGLFFKRKVNLPTWIAVVLSVVALYLLCIKGSFSLSPGDLLILICAVCFAVHILVIDHFTAYCDGVKLSCLQFLFAGVISTVCMFLFEEVDFAAIWSCILPLLYVGIFSCGVGYTLQILAQKGSNPTVVTILLSLESVFAVIAGAIILKQQMSVREYIGCGVMFAAVILAQIDFPVKQKAE